MPQAQGQMRLGVVTVSLWELQADEALLRGFFLEEFQRLDTRAAGVEILYCATTRQSQVFSGTVPELAASDRGVEISHDVATGCYAAGRDPTG